MSAARAGARRVPVRRARAARAVRVARTAAAVALAAGVMGLAAATAPPRAAALGVLANPDSLTTVHDRLATVVAPGVLANDLTLLGTTAILVSGTSHGSVDLAPDGGYTYSPDDGFVGTDSFTYRDSGLLTNTVAVTISVTNSAPVAAGDAYTAHAGVTLRVAAPGVLGNDTDADGDALVAAVVDGGGEGSPSLAADGSFTFTADASFRGVRTFTYRASDGLATSAATTVSITVTAAETPAPTPTPAASPTGRPSPTPPASPGPIPAPSGTGTPATSPEPSGEPGATGAPGVTAAPIASPPGSAGSPPAGPGVIDPGPAGGAGGPGARGGSGGEPGSGGTFALPTVALDPLDVFAEAGLAGIEWTVPALVLTVPGLLLIVAVLAQAAMAGLWAPLVRRWLAGVGVRRREPRTRRAA